MYTLFFFFFLSFSEFVKSFHKHSHDNRMFDGWTKRRTPGQRTTGHDVDTGVCSRMEPQGWAILNAPHRSTSSENASRIIYPIEIERLNGGDVWFEEERVLNRTSELYVFFERRVCRETWFCSAIHGNVVPFPRELSVWQWATVSWTKSAFSSHDLHTHPQLFLVVGVTLSWKPCFSVCV